MNLKDLSKEELQELIQEKEKEEREAKVKARREYERKRDELVTELVEQAKRAHNELCMFKTKAMQLISEFHDTANEYGDIRKQSKGGFSLRTHEGDKKLVYDRNTKHEYDERAAKAEVLLKEFLEDKVKKPTRIPDSEFGVIARAIGYHIVPPLWQHFQTANFERIIAAFEEARFGDVRAVDGNTGYGKSYACRKYLQIKRKETFLIRATEDLSVKGLIEEVAAAVGVPERGNRTHMRKSIVNQLKQMEAPLLIFDEAENLSDIAWGAIKTLIDYLENDDVGSAQRYLCGIVVLGMDIKQKIGKKADKRKGVYPQIQRRFSGSWRQLFDIEPQEIIEMAETLGISNTGAQKWLRNNITNYDSLGRLISRALILHDRDGSQVTADEFKALNEE